MPQECNIPIKGFIETSFIDWKQHLASVVFTAGCNFRCPFCHNRELVTGAKMEDVPLSHIFFTLRKFRAWVDRVVVTGGEPSLHAGLLPLLERFKQQGLLVKLDTNGSHPRVVRDAVQAGLVDYVAMDVKGPLSRYDRWCGVKVDTDAIEESIAFLLGGCVDYEFRMTVVPFFHREEDAYEVAAAVKGAKRLFVQEFVPRNTLNPAFEQITPFHPDKIARVRETVRRIFSDAPVPGTLPQ